MAPEVEAELSQALAHLAGRDAALRKDAAAMLVDLATDESIAASLRPHFVRLLEDPLPEIRAAGCVGLRAAGLGDDGVGLLQRALGDTEAMVRREAAHGLAHVDLATSGPVLRRALADPDAQVAFEAALGLAAHRDASGAEILIAAIEDSVRRFSALGALAQLAEPRAQAAAERVMGRFFISDFDRTQAAGLLARLGVESGRDFLLARLARPRAEDRGLAMELCGEHRVLAAIPVLRESLNNAKDPFRGTAARSLGLLGEDPTGSTLDRMASDPSEEFDIRCDAMEGLMFLGTPGATAALQRLSAGGEVPEIRAAADDALGWLARSAPKATP